MSAFQTLAMPCVSRGIQTSSSHAPATAPKLRHSARSRGIHAPLSRHHRCCDYAQHDGAVMPCVSRGMWEPINNPDFKPVEFDRFKAQAGLNRFLLCPAKRAQATRTIGFKKSATT